MAHKDAKITINMISKEDKSDNSLSVNYKDDTPTGVFSNKFKFLKDFDNPDISFFPEIQQTLYRNATKIKTRNTEFRNPNIEGIIY